MVAPDGAGLPVPRPTDDVGGRGDVGQADGHTEDDGRGIAALASNAGRLKPTWAAQVNPEPTQLSLLNVTALRNALDDFLKTRTTSPLSAAPACCGTTSNNWSSRCRG